MNGCLGYVREIVIFSIDHLKKGELSQYTNKMYVTYGQPSRTSLSCIKAEKYKVIRISGKQKLELVQMEESNILEKKRENLSRVTLYSTSSTSAAATTGSSSLETLLSNGPATNFIL